MSWRLGSGIGALAGEGLTPCPWRSPCASHSASRGGWVPGWAGHREGAHLAELTQPAEAEESWQDLCPDLLNLSVISHHKVPVWPPSSDGLVPIYKEHEELL